MVDLAFSGEGGFEAGGLVSVVESVAPEELVTEVSRGGESPRSFITENER